MAAGSMCGHIREFDPHTSDWTVFIRQLENYFIVNGIEEKEKVRKRAILLNALSEEAYKLIYNLSLPAKPEEKSYADLVKILNDHFKATESAFASRYKFYSAVKSPQETVAEWAARVRSLACNCEFEANMLDMLLRDRFVIGFEKGAVQDRLFEENMDSQFASVVRIASAKMAAKQNTMLDEPSVKVEPGLHHVTHRNKRHTVPVQQSQNRPSTSSSGGTSAGGAKVKCLVCGRNNHSTNRCRYREFKCNICNIKGHLAPMCPKKVRKKERLLNSFKIFWKLKLTMM